MGLSAPSASKAGRASPLNLASAREQPGVLGSTSLRAITGAQRPLQRQSHWSLPAQPRSARERQGLERPPRQREKLNTLYLAFIWSRARLALSTFIVIGASAKPPRVIAATRPFTASSDIFRVRAILGT